MKLMELQKKILPQITELLKTEPEAISSVKVTPEGWVVQCEVLEKKSIPETYDRLKVFEFTLDNQAEITNFTLVKRMRRGEAG